MSPPLHSRRLSCPATIRRSVPVMYPDEAAVLAGGLYARFRALGIVPIYSYANTQSYRWNIEQC